ncbi:polysaccharide deacetylase family protein [Mycobacterium sp.]|uniref:polysaccharide deacetylase family protein n=1 Tax=Mycobacterium sp. TaxID=1785 RepID=UPI002CF061C7|nr:polysaccharide deacetylase family protein [Mycobacterium sp.]HKP42863.1 polysaccharide deacetylase family protein [Mycobacterium sp.]
MISRRAFLATVAGSVAAAGIAVADAAAAPPDLDPGAVASLNRGRAPTQWGMSLPGVATTFAAGGKQIALTFDACRGACDDTLLATLARNAVPAVLFLCGMWIDTNPGSAERLAANPLFEIGNHGTRHIPLSVTGRSAYGIGGTRSTDEVVAEVWTNHNKITALTGKPPTWFRPGTAHYDDVAVEIVHELGERPLGFTVNADKGATASAASVRSSIVGATPGSIVIAHMNHPEAGTAAGVGDAITTLRSAGWDFVGLSGQAVQ